MKRRLPCLVVCALALSFPGPAAAQQKCQAPPGNAGIDQYCETIPDARGDRGTGDRGDGGGGPLSSAVRRRLRAEGGAGRALLEVLGGAVGGSADRDAAKEKERSGGDADRSQADPSASGSPLSAVKAAVESGDTTGEGLVWVLLAVLLLGAAAAWLRFRRGGGNEEPS